MCLSLPGQCCALCGTDLPGHHESYWCVPGLCHFCMSRMEILRPGSSNSCRRESGLSLCGVYSGKLAELIIRYKKGYDSRLSATLAALLLPHVLQCIHERGWKDFTTILTHPPGSRKSRMYRGYDHMAKICRHLSSWLGSKYQHPVIYRQFLSRKSSTAQKTLNREERLLNVANSFQIKQRIVNACVAGSDPDNTRIILLDDVVTTGATLVYSRQLLHEAGFHQVAAMALASD